MQSYDPNLLKSVASYMQKTVQWLSKLVMEHKNKRYTDAYKLSLTYHQYLYMLIDDYQTFEKALGDNRQRKKRTSATAVKPLYFILVKGSFAFQLYPNLPRVYRICDGAEP